MYSEQDLQLLELICEEVEGRGIDLATNFNDWVVLTYGLVSDFGETGRSYFHRICRLYQKGYSREDCEKMYDYDLKHSRGQAHFGSICYLANACGIDTGALRRRVWAKQKRVELAIEPSQSSQLSPSAAERLLQNGKMAPGSLSAGARVYKRCR